MALQAQNSSSRGTQVARGLLAVVGAVLLLDALVLIALGHFNVGVQVPAVLGAGALVLAQRLDTAAELAQLQPGALIAVCGGVDWGETESEAEVMARYLQQRHGIAPERLVLEKLSTSTELNLQLSRPLLAARGVAADAPTALVSSDFHLMRALRIAQRQGLSQMYPVAAPTPLATRFNAWLREYFAMASSWVLREV
ncbi:hypothetical protein MA05_10550 [Comamonas aquatica]|uniref:YdcF family protein n=1 Tax=Comamonas aquatica TaxID=225991 RepID=UPI0005ECBFDD|nr:YdcF family protein [Comamonas aquatica]ANY62449.1 hypothetical protein MA05_10550 [Comamonas aquatica]